MIGPLWDAVLDEISQEIRRRGTQPLQLQAPAQPDGEHLDPYRRLQGLLERLTQAEQQLELAPLPAGDTSWGDEVRPGNREHNLRKKAVRARLELLGYAPGAEGDSGALRQAVLQFQEDAGLDISEHGMYGYPEQFIPQPEYSSGEYVPHIAGTPIAHSGSRAATQVGEPVAQA